jgi:hypothetical protein
MTTGLKPDERAAMAKAVARNSFLLLLSCAFVGAYVLDFFGLSIPAVQVAGGIVLCAMGWTLLNKPDVPDAVARATAVETETGKLRRRLYADDAAHGRSRLHLRRHHARRQSASDVRSLLVTAFGTHCTSSSLPRFTSATDTRMRL